MANNMPSNNNFLKILIQSGMAGIAILALIMYYLTVSNHINSNTAALLELKASIQQTNKVSEAQVEVLRSQAKAIEGVKDAILQLRIK